MDICSICHEPFDCKQQIVIAKHVSDRNLEESRKRGHYFHRSCLDQWKKHCILTYDTQDLPVGFICPMDRDEICRLYTVPNYEIVGFDIRYYDSDMLRVLNECRVNRHFIQQISDIDEVDRKNKTLAYYVCYLGDYNIAIKLLAAGADFNKHVGDSGFTPLMAAVCQNHSNIVNRLLANRQVRQGCNAMDHAGMTAFMYACKGCFNRIITDFLVNEIPTPHQVRHCLVCFKAEFESDTLYGKEIMHKLNHYLKPK
jgi:hypothetical protein